MGRARIIRCALIYYNDLSSPKTFASSRQTRSRGTLPPQSAFIWHQFINSEGGGGLCANPNTFFFVFVGLFLTLAHTIKTLLLKSSTTTLMTPSSDELWQPFLQVGITHLHSWNWFRLSWKCGCFC